MMTSWPGNARCITTRRWIPFTMMTSSNGNIFRVTCPLWGKATGHGGFPSQRPVTRSFDNFFDLRLYKQLNKYSRHWWFETPLCSLWGRCNTEDQKCVPLMFCLLFAWTRCRKKTSSCRRFEMSWRSRDVTYSFSVHGSHLYGGCISKGQ